MSKRELEPCPFCGRPVELRYERRYAGPDTYSVSCGFVSCGINPSTGEHLDEPEASAAWNRRSPSRQLFLEEAAKVADEMAINRARVSDVAEHACKSIARRIRSLSHPDKEKGDE